jgi:hypothetical protein
VLGTVWVQCGYCVGAMWVLCGTMWVKTLGLSGVCTCTKSAGVNSKNQPMVDCGGERFELQAA